MGSHDFFYRILGVKIAVNCSTPELGSLVDTQWGFMACEGPHADLRYAVSRNESSSLISIQRPGQPSLDAADDGQFLYELEGDSTIALQLLRKELYFLHAAVAEFEGRAVLFVAESGGGKSTTLWGLLHHGWNYLSDELAPIDLSTMRVQAYPRALCLKQPPPSDYPLPAATVRTSRTFHVAAPHLPQVSQRDSCPLAAVYFVKYWPDANAPAIRPISAAEACARLYANALNQLAHANAGLDAAVGIAKSIPCFLLDSADLAKTCELVVSHAP